MGDGPNEGQCHFYLTRKHRYCRFRPKEGEQYCPEHACIKGIQGDRKRIPCPLNPSHNCYEDNLEKHLKKCNVTKLQKATEQASYYVKGINTSAAGGESGTHSEKVCVKDLTSTELASTIAKVNRLYEERVDKLETAIYEHPCIREEFCESDSGELSEAFRDQSALRKELLQQASLVGQLDKLRLLNGDHCFVEMGAGKGKLSHWIQKAGKERSNNFFLLVERSSVRYKMDSYHKLEGDESKFKRIRIDIGDLCLGRVPELRSASSVVVVGKHLCGGATDMGIKCGVETLSLGDKPLHTPVSTLNSNQTSAALSTSSTNCMSDPSSSEKFSSEDGEKPGVHSGPGTEKTQTYTSVDAQLDFTGDFSPIPCQSDSLVRRSGLAATSVNRTQDQQCTKCGSNNTAEIGSSTGINSDSGTEIDEGKKQFCEESGDVQEPPCKCPKLEKQELVNQRLPEGIMIALCCHHRCTWDTYLGKDFILSCGLSPQDFDLLTRLSSWATCAKVKAKSSKSNKEKSDDSSPVHKSDSAVEGKKGERDGGEKDTEDHRVDDLIQSESSQSLREKLSVQEREEIGRKCKRLLDTGRLHYLRSKGMECFLREYINEELTPENVVLIAKTPKPGCLS